jgi:hypothetical protein
MTQIVLPSSELIKLPDTGILIYPAAAMSEITMLEKLSVQSNLLKCADLDLISKNTPDVINWLADNALKLHK